MVDSILIFMDRSLGCCHASSNKLTQKIRPIVYMAVCAAHGFLYGTLYAPAQAILYGFSLKQTIAWIIAGLPFDCIHGISNFFCGILIMPVISILRLAERHMDQGIN